MAIKKKVKKVDDSDNWNIGDTATVLMGGWTPTRKWNALKSAQDLAKKQQTAKEDAKFYKKNKVNIKNTSTPTKSTTYSRKGNKITKTVI